jgi:hypothetical protein
MKLTPDQKTAVAQWAAEGMDLSAIQKRLEEEFEIAITYLETRLLVSELELHLADPDEDEADDSVEAPGEEDPSLASNADPLDAPPGENGASVTVTMDRVAQPHAMASGKVTFSDGEKADWYFDPMGRMGLDPETPGYRPAEADVLAFQQELERVARTAGF